MALVENIESTETRISEAMPGDYFALLKPRVMSLVVFTAFVGMLLAPGSINPFIAIIAILAIAVGGGASGALNMWYDADIDAVMTRTAKRPIPAGRIARGEALTFGLILSVFAVITLGTLTNWVAGGLLAFTIFFYAVIYTMWLKRSTPQNIVIGGGSGVQTAGWFKKEINSLDDLKGLNFRSTGLQAEVQRKLGMNPTSVPPGEIFAALQSGTLDGAEWVGPANDLAFGFQNVAKYMYAPTFSDVYGGIEFGVNLQAWEALSDEQRMIVEVASEAEANRSSADTFHSNLLAFEKFKAMDGLTIGTLPDDVWEALRKTSREVIEQVAGTSEFHERFVAGYYDYVEKSTKYKHSYDTDFLARRENYFV